MSLFSRRTALLSLAALAGCGYAPLYAPGGDASGLRGSIRVAEPSSEVAYRLVEALEQRLGQPNAARYALGYSLDIDRQTGGVLPNQRVTRYTLVGRLDYTLRSETGGDVVSSGMVENFTNYSATQSAIARQTAAEDAEERLIVMLADDLVTRLALLDL